jgi:hypothetical protein
VAGLNEAFTRADFLETAFAAAPAAAITQQPRHNEELAPVATELRNAEKNSAHYSVRSRRNHARRRVWAAFRKLVEPGADGTDDAPARAALLRWFVHRVRVERAEALYPRFRFLALTPPTAPDRRPDHPRTARIPRRPQARGRRDARRSARRPRTRTDRTRTPESGVRTLTFVWW